MSHRRARVAQELRDRVAEIVRELRDPRLLLVAIVDAEIAPDLSFARVFFRTAGDAAEASEALESAKPLVRRRLGQRMRVRRVPELDFRQDASLEQGERVEQILSELAVERERRRSTGGGD